MVLLFKKHLDSCLVDKVGSGKPGWVWETQDKVKEKAHTLDNTVKRILCGKPKKQEEHGKAPKKFRWDNRQISVNNVSQQQNGYLCSLYYPQTFVVRVTAFGW